MNNENLNAALFAAQIGFPVFPCDPNTKRPLIKDWPNQATTNGELVQSFWATYPNAMIGAVTGEKSGFFALDIDVKDGEDAFLKLDTFKKQHNGTLTPAFITKTPSGGLHLFFRMPENIDLRSSTSKIGQGFDIRANGGYVIFAGSVRADGKKYEIINNEGAKNGA